MSEALVAYEAKTLDPKVETEYGHRAAKELIAVVKQAGLSKRFGGAKDHIFYEGWQAVGKMYGYSIKTGEAVPVEVDGVKGAKGSASILDSDGTVIGGAEAYCLRDEPNWKTKPFFQLASMSQTRAGSKAMRNLLAFVVSLAGYSTTPAEELDGIYEAEVVEPKKPPQAPPPQKAPTTPGMVSTEDAEKIRDLMIAIGYEKKNILQILSIRVGHELKRMGEITQEQAVGIIGDLEGERAKKEGSGE